MSDMISMDTTSNPYEGLGGVNGSVEDYEQSMLELNVPVRDGDDSIELHDEEDNEPEDGVQEVNDDNLGEPELPQDHEINFNPSSVEEASAQLAKSEEGFNQMKATVLSRGVTQEELAQMEANYAANGTMTDHQYNRLAEVGYPKDFIDSYIRGQEALSMAYANQFIASMGGVDNYHRVVQTLEMASPESVKTFEDAVNRRDLATAKAIINLAGSIQQQRYGQPAQRSVTQRAIPVQATTTAPQGFESQSEMIQAMSDKRYNRDPAYTEEVLRKVKYAN